MKVEEAVIAVGVGEALGVPGLERAGEDGGNRPSPYLPIGQVVEPEIVLELAAAEWGGAPAAAPDRQLGADHLLELVLTRGSRQVVVKAGGVEAPQVSVASTHFPFQP